MKRAKTDRLQELKGLAGKQQYLLHDQIESFLDESASVEDMDEVYIALNDLKVDVFDSHEEAQQKLKLKRREEKKPQEKQLLQHPMRYDDPVRMYLREMGRVPLLDREGEVEIAKRIESGEHQIASAMFKTPVAIREIESCAEKLRAGKCQLGDIIQLDMGNWDAEISPKKEFRRATTGSTRILKSYHGWTESRAEAEKRAPAAKKTQLLSEANRREAKLVEDVL